MLDYPLHVFLAVLAAAALHATWNALVRGGSDPLLHTAAVVGWTGVFALPTLFFLPLPTPQAALVLVGSVIIHIAYYTTLAGAYRNGNLSTIYPIIRGCAPIMISLGSLVFLDETLNLTNWLGVLLISAGVLVIALRSGLENVARALKWALACSLTIAIYSIIDGYGARISGNALSFAAWLFVSESIAFWALLTALGRGKALRNYVRDRFRNTALAGIMSATGYTVVLWAMSQAPLALVSATRETSVLFAGVLGAILLKEKVRARQIVAASIILCGLIAMRL
ncbi:DMT family transporter [Orrella marina]|uniref:EamA family transporter n=1 Tax=Orrella marina TaxID=2163011 RepID=A0A2R4XIP1_9BURK|nr:DMT family transporter [Orrella marina]AWB33579.1 EamA family transporter [Orrella marina]